LATIIQQENDAQRRLTLGSFLRTRRERILPEQIGFAPGMRRRTPGLRREEVAVAASVSTTWYTYLEQGRDINVSRVVLERIADVLQLNNDERNHLFTLAQQAPPTNSAAYADKVRPAYERVLAALGQIPAFITGSTYDFLAWNRAATLVFTDFGSLPQRERNLLWLLFTDTPFRARFTHGEDFAQEVMETLRCRTGRDIDNPTLATFIQALERISPEFRQKWPQQNVRHGCTKYQEISHPVAGQLFFETATFQLVEHTYIRCHMYTAGDEETQRALAALLALK
jgi:transcriptional regulator with XRE-family HTH domain